MIVPPPIDEDPVADPRLTVDDLVALAMADPPGRQLGEPYDRHVVRVLRRQATELWSIV